MSEKFTKAILVVLMSAVITLVLVGCVKSLPSNSQASNVSTPTSSSNVTSETSNSNKESNVSSNVITLEDWRVTSDDINVREKPNTDADVSYILYYNEVVEVLKDKPKDDGWLELKSGGYVYSENLKKIGSDDSEKYSDYQIKSRNVSYVEPTDSLIVRSEPTSSSDNLGYLSKSTPTKV